MLRFIFGRPASGKTYTVLRNIANDVENGRQVILIVPEQFSFESEREVLRTVGDSAALSVSVMSFSRLFDEVGRYAGGIAGRVLTDSDKIIFMSKALKNVVGELELWSRYAHSVSFAKTMLDTVGEFKINAVSPSEVASVSYDTPDGTLKSKLHDIAVIYEAYDALVGEKFIDPADRLTKLYHMLDNCRFFEGKTVYLDSFKGFTGQQYKIIERVLSQAQEVTVSFTNDIENIREYDIFTNIRSAVSRIEKAARRYGVKIKEPVVLSHSRYCSESLSALERLLSSGRTSQTEDDGGITLCVADTAFDEAEFAARTIRRLVREEGYRYRDFVIIARDADAYSEAVTSACLENGVSCFTDKRLPLSSFPAAAAAEAAINAIGTYSTEAVLRFHKTGLGTLNYDEIPVLENYTALWNINGAQWNNEWDMDVRGFVSGEDVNQNENDGQLAQINALRKRAIDPIKSFEAAFNGTAADMAAAIVKLFEECNVGEKLADMCGKFSSDEREFSSDALKQGYDMYMHLLDCLVRCFGQDSLSRREFTEALKLSVSLSSVGLVPQTLDEVTFGSADRIRPSRPKVAFILGANQGVFPAYASSAGILSVPERRTLIELGIDIADNSLTSAIDENFLVYTNVCCPSEKLFICRHLRVASGEESEEAAFVAEIAEKIPCKKVREHAGEVTKDNAPETEQAAFSAFCRCLRENPDGAQTVKLGLEGTDTDTRIDTTLEKLVKKDSAITPKTAELLYGKNMHMSASKLDTFNKCHFSYFCRYGLSAKKLRPADFDVLQRGTLVHYVLERIISAYKKKICVMTREELDTKTDMFVKEYLDGIRGISSIMNARYAFLTDNISRALKEVVWQIAREFEQSDFEPSACELKIGMDGDIPSVKFPFDGGNIYIDGSIDRVDTYNGYVRVIDYKTGSRSFRLPDVLFGLNLQMLVYLYAAVRGCGKDDGAAAGIFYMPSRRDLSDSGMAMNGLMQGDINLITAMDKKAEGEFVPKPAFTKNGELSKRCNSFIPPDGFSTVFDYIEKLIARTGNSIASGDISISPIDGDTAACSYCDYSSVCGIENGEHMSVPKMNNAEVLIKMEEAEKNEF